jgi:NADH dehydrogenase/NADH:ubiquinone oxidoreductase subunit G
MSENQLVLNGKTIYFHPGQTILEVARENGIQIPTLCYLKDAAPTGACRICLVEVEGARNLTTAHANWLTNPAYDPETLTAEYKACAVRIEKA